MISPEEKRQKNAKRNRDMRRRRVREKRCALIEVDQALIDDLVAQEFLKRADTRNLAAIGRAISKWQRIRQRYSDTR
jgi:hypothetical protein